ncbi:hypothetical protein QAD02_006649 [Eretmocerus hayati]|uniref:Uncharacterized protein n=1 Tax=Eretmocerus hayati TaxID=131215 RepID=A0ACC2N1U8_9HYME|nr:hypothetical protein QAD02_006649 [Eretmocerus hayati]
MTLFSMDAKMMIALLTTFIVACNAYLIKGTTGSCRRSSDYGETHQDLEPKIQERNSEYSKKRIETFLSVIANIRALDQSTRMTDNLTQFYDTEMFRRRIQWDQVNKEATFDSQIFMTDSWRNAFSEILCFVSRARSWLKNYEDLVINSFGMNIESMPAECQSLNSFDSWQNIEFATIVNESNKMLNLIERVNNMLINRMYELNEQIDEILHSGNSGDGDWLNYATQFDNIFRELNTMLSRLEKNVKLSAKSIPKCIT